MSGWKTKHYAEQIGMTVRGYLSKRLDAGWSFADIAREVGANNRAAIARLCKRHGLSVKRAHQ